MRRMARLVCAGLLGALALPLQSCGNAREIQNLAYVTAVGLDYNQGQYSVYAQVLNFSNIARTEDVALGKRVPIWIGVGKGETLSGALTDVSTNAQFPIFWGHMKAVIVTERILNRGVKEIYLTLNRNREIRYNILVYGTRDKLEGLLTETSLFNLSPLDTILFSGMQQDSSESFLLPANGNHLIAALNEPGNPALIPSISTSSRNWMEDNEPRSMLEINGAFFMENGRVNDWMSLQELKGIRWFDRELDSTPLLITMSEGHKAVLAMAHPKMKIRPVAGGAEPRFDLTLHVKGMVNQSLDTPLSKLGSVAEQTIREEIKDTFTAGLAKQCDPYGLEEALYRHRPAAFRKATQSGHFFLNERSLRRITVKVDVTSTGKYKGIVR